MRLAVLLMTLAITASSGLVGQVRRERTPVRNTASAEPGTAVSEEEFRAFQWIVGRWRGAGHGTLAAVPTFYEGYSVLNDSTLMLHTYADSTFTAVTDSTWFEWRSGRLIARPARGNSRFVTRFTADTVFWGAQVSYARLSRDRWRAMFQPRSPGGPQPYYELQRVP